VFFFTFILASWSEASPWKKKKNQMQQRRYFPDKKTIFENLSPSKNTSLISWPGRRVWPQVSRIIRLHSCVGNKYKHKTIITGCLNLSVKKIAMEKDLANG
jgi:hypothetical protein